MEEIKETVFTENETVNFGPKSIGRIVSARYGENETYDHVDVFVAGFLKPDGSLKFKVSNESAWEVGLACGGEIAVYLEQIN